MSAKTLTTKIIIRNDIATNWTNNNPTLLKGEIGFELDTKKYKIGDGEQSWFQLPYFSHINEDEKQKIDLLIEMLNTDAFGNVDDVKVNGNSVVTNKIANIVIGTVVFSETSQTAGSAESFTGDITLHKIAKTGSYNDLLDKLNVVDNLDSTSATDVLSANQGRTLKNLVQAIPSGQSYSTLQAMVTALNSYNNSQLNIGANLYLQQLEVPDFWVYSKEEANVPYTYTTDADFISAVRTNGSVQVGYYRVSFLETDKVDLTNYYTKGEIDELLSNIDLSDYAKQADLEKVINNTTQISRGLDAPYGDDNETRYTSLYFGDAEAGGSWGIGVGAKAKTGQLSIAIGNMTNAYGSSDVVVGNGSGRTDASSADGSKMVGVAIGAGAKISGNYTAQIGYGTNNVPGSLQFRNYQLVTAEGKLPDERLNDTVVTTVDTLILDGGSAEV